MLELSEAGRREEAYFGFGSRCDKDVLMYLARKPQAPAPTRKTPFSQDSPDRNTVHLPGVRRKNAPSVSV